MALKQMWQQYREDRLVRKIRKCECLKHKLDLMINNYEKKLIDLKTKNKKKRKLSYEI